MIQPEFHQLQKVFRAFIDPGFPILDCALRDAEIVPELLLCHAGCFANVFDCHFSSSFQNLVPVHDSETVTVNIPDAKPKPFAFDGNVLSEIPKFHIVSFLPVCPVGQAC